ncbi:la-related protein 1C-like [Impatiens glandulifera]|uniref:la-related protein 1C-like n=1 Tax=Impatiens glandulifera TaxID=253017 RepID=UPI001FB059C0|nr:la-related protein 1C-like [Impatiens glandulifera]
MAASSANSLLRNHGPDGVALNNNIPHAKQSPWMHVVIGSESETLIHSGPSPPVSPAKASDDSATDPQMENADNGSGINNAGVKLVWNKPSNDTVDAGTVMGGVSWPALSESARASPKSSPSHSLRVVTDGLISLPQATGVERSPKSAFVKRSHSKESPHKESGQKGGGGGLIAQSPGHNEHSSHRNSFRRGSHPRGDSSHHHHHHNNNHGGRRDHNGNHDWNRQRSFNNNRDMQMQSPRGIPRGFMRNPPPNNSAFVPPPPPPLHVPPFGGPLVYPEFASQVFYVPAPSPESLRGVHIVPPISPHAMFFIPDPQLHSKIVNQIDYYFSNENLVKDTFLRLNMDDQGWVPIKLIAGFKKVLMLTDNIQLILDSLLSSAKVEIQGEKVRRRNDWSKWIMRPSSVSPQYGRRLAGDDMTESMHNLVLDENS